MSFLTEKFFSKSDWNFNFRRVLRRVFLEDWLIKAIALFITVGLWLGVTGLRSTTTARLRSVPLNIRVSNNMEITNSPAQEVELEITGDKRKIDALNPRDLVVSLDLADVAVGERMIQITPENVNVELPLGVKLKEIQPSKIAVRLEAVAEREVAVRVETEGSLNEDFEIYGKTVMPPKVRVRGPESFVKSLDFVSTEKINIEYRISNFTDRQVALNLINPKVTVLDTAVDVAFKIGEKRIERLFNLHLQTETGKKSVTAILYGARSIVESLTAEKMKVEANKNEVGDNSLNLILPAEIQGQIEIRKLKLN